MEIKNILTGSWNFCGDSGYGELHCSSNGTCVVSVNSASRNLNFYYDMVADTLYATTGSKEQNHISRYTIKSLSKDVINLGLINHKLSAEQNTLTLKRIETNYNPNNLDNNPYKKLLYQSVFEARKNIYGCRNDTSSAPKVDLGVIDWEAFGLDTLEKE
ncbi:MAG: hypothetical protein RJQ14_12125 [Marinoscillum sp.]